MEQKRLTKEQIPQFVLAGNATVTLKSGTTGAHFTYKIIQAKQNKDCYYIKLLHGPDNDKDYRYVGCYFKDTKHFHVTEQYRLHLVFTWPKSIRAIKYVLEHIDDVRDNIYVYHEGKCGRCGRKLTTPESIERGLGPECYKEMLNETDRK